MKKTLLLLILAINLACFGQNTDTVQADTEICLSSIVPFTLKNTKEYIANDSVEGSIVIHLFIDNNATIQGFNILFLNIKYLNKSKKVNHYVYLDEVVAREDYPVDIQPFWVLVEDYVGALEVEKDKNVQVAKINKYMLRLKIGK